MQNKKRLFIVGASHLGREIESWLSLISVNERDWEICGYLHTFQDHSPLQGYSSDFKILGAWEEYPFLKDDYCIIAVSDSSWKEKIYLRLKDKVGIFTYIAPTAIIGKFSSIGEGAIICPGCIVSTGVKIGNCVLLNIGSQIGHDCQIGSYSSIMPNVDLGGHVVIGDKVYIGAKATILPKIIVENNSTIGAGSLVIKRVKKGKTVFGNPAEYI